MDPLTRPELEGGVVLPLQGMTVSSASTASVLRLSPLVRERPEWFTEPALQRPVTTLAAALETPPQRHSSSAALPPSPPKPEQRPFNAAGTKNHAPIPPACIMVACG